jgi:hypothetical protein
MGLLRHGSAPVKSPAHNTHLTAEPGHVVQFYDTEDFLCAKVTDFLGDGLPRVTPAEKMADAKAGQGGG